MALSVVSLGTASQAPTLSRALNSVVLRFEKSRFISGVSKMVKVEFESKILDSYLIDCGEGTQAQLGASTVRHSAISKVLITHLHGDHCFGFGVQQNR